MLDLQQQEKEPLVFQSNIYISCAVVLYGINPVTLMQMVQSPSKDNLNLSDAKRPRCLSSESTRS